MDLVVPVKGGRVRGGGGGWCVERWSGQSEVGVVCQVVGGHGQAGERLALSVR